MQTPDPRYEAAQDLAGIDLADMFRKTLSALRRNLWLILLSSLLFGALGSLLSFRQAPYYSSRASIIIDPRVTEGMEATQAPTIFLADALVVDSEVEVLLSEQILQRVADRLDLAERAKQSLAAEGSEIPDAATLRQNILRGLENSLDIEREGETFVVRILATAAEPGLAANLANAVADEYFAAQIENQTSQAKQASDWLQSELKALSSKVIAAETAVEHFMFDNDIPDEDAQGVVEDELAETNAKLIAARGEVRAARSEAETIDRAIAQIGAPDDTSGSSVLASQLITALGGQEGLRTTQIKDELDRLREVRNARTEIAETQIASLEENGAELKADLADIGEKQVRLRELRREASAMQIQYESLLARYEQSQGEDQFFRSNARVIERAAPPVEPANPSAPLVVAAAAIGGLIVGLGLVFLREQLNDTLRSSDDVLKQLGTPYFGALPRLAERDLRYLPPELEALAPDLRSAARREIALLSHAAVAPFSLLNESFRRILFALKSRQPSGHQVIAAVSAVSGEGKSFFAANFAFFLAGQGHRVLLVDGDLRNPSLSRSLAPLFEGGVPEAGIESKGDGMAIATLTENLLFMYRRNFQHLSAAEDLIESMVDLLAQADLPVDFVILDTAPLAYVSDSLALSSVVDGAVLLIDWAGTSVGTLRRVLKLNAAVTDKIIGACLSKTTKSLMRRYEFIPVNDIYYYSKAEASGRSPR